MLFENIPSYNWEKIMKRAKTLNKYGCTVTLKGVSMYKGIEVITIDLNIPETLEAGKWEFMGFKKCCGDDVLYFGDIPIEYHNTSMYCEHCNSNRNRKSIVIIKDIESNTAKQVGKTCVKKYLGNGFEMLANLLLTVDEILTDDKSDYVGYSVYNKYVNVHKYLYYCIQSINNRGYIKKNTFDNNGLPVDTTAYDALRLYDDNRSKDINIAEVLESMQVYRDFCKTKNDDFTHNVLTLLSNDYIERKYINMIAFIPTFLLNKCKFDAKKQAREEKRTEFNSSLSNEYIGNVGDKVSCIARLIHYSTFESYYTYRGELNYRYTFIDDAGNLIQWRTQKSIINDLDKAIEDRTSFNISGTVKEYKEYKGRFYTVLTRCKIK